MKSMESFPWTWPPDSYDGLETLVPYSKVYGQFAHLGWRNLVDAPKNFPLPPGPEVYVSFCTNPLTSIGEPQIVAEALKKIGFIVVITHVENEMTQFADVVLPDLTELEKLEPVYFIRSALGRKFYHGVMLRQPVVERIGTMMDITDIFTELADRIGMLEEYNKAVNYCFSLIDPYKLQPSKKYTVAEIADRWCKSTTNGAHDLNWFKKNGAILTPTSVEEQYDVYLKMKALKLRYYLPYVEHVKRTGEELARNLAKVGINWWPTREYVALPTYFPPITEEVSPEYDFYVTVARSFQYSNSANVDIPWLIEIGEHVRGQSAILMNAQAAKARGIRDGDEVCVQSEVGKVQHKVQLCQGIRPDTLVIAGQFGQWATPIAKDTGRVSQTPLTPIRQSWTDHVTSNMQGTVVKAKVYKASGG
jgi:phenylacetyl-CoA:acceptor oxidoreductase